jgi:hypothetical protein
MNTLLDCAHRVRLSQGDMEFAPRLLTPH